MRFAAACAVLLLPTAAMAGPPASASASDAGRTRAESQFHEFAKKWMSNVKRLQTQDRSKPTLTSAGGQSTYRGYGDDYSIELRPTGHPTAPFVGLLRYTELMYSCPSPGAADCTVASKVPVTEIFRYENGRWSY